MNLVIMRFSVSVLFYKVLGVVCDIGTRTVFFFTFSTVCIEI
jgi:hypothetical protein